MSEIGRAHFPVLIMNKMVTTSFPNPYYDKMFFMVMIYNDNILCILKFPVVTCQ